MKGISQCFLAWFIAGAAVAQPTQVVVPNGLATVEGNSSTSEPFTSQSFRFQQVFDASQFAFLGTTNIARIDGISFRIDGASTQNVSMSFGGKEKASTTHSFCSR